MRWLGVVKEEVKGTHLTKPRCSPLHKTNGHDHNLHAGNSLTTFACQHVMPKTKAMPFLLVTELFTAAEL